jgi:hypothetical protein
MTLKSPSDILRRIANSDLNELVQFYKCPYCNFRNIHEYEITHHIKYNNDPSHEVDVNKLDKHTFIVTKKQRYKKAKFL